MKNPPRTIPLPLSPENWAALMIVAPVTSAEWDQLILLLVTMRPALVADGDDPRSETE